MESLKQEIELLRLAISHLLYCRNYCLVERMFYNFEQFHIEYPLLTIRFEVGDRDSTTHYVFEKYFQPPLLRLITHGAI